MSASPSPVTHLFRIASLVAPSWFAWYVAYTAKHVDTLNRTVALALGPLWALLCAALIVRVVVVLLTRAPAHGDGAASRLARIDVLTSSGCALAWTSAVALVGALTLGWTSLAVVGLLGTGLLHAVVLYTFAVVRPRGALYGASITRRFSPASPTEGEDVIEELRLLNARVPIGFRLFATGRVGKRWATTRHVLDAVDVGFEVVFEAQIGPAVRGEHAPEPMALWLEDSFGLCQSAPEPIEAPKLRVLPQRRSIDRAAPLLGQGVGPSPARAARRLPTEGHLDLREYREGDDVRRIHWVRSLVARELVVRVPDELPPDQPRVRLVLDTFFPEALELSCDAPSELLDALVATWLALGRALALAGYRVSLVAAVPRGGAVAPVRHELSSRAETAALQLGAEIAWQGLVSVDALLTDERTLVVARGVVTPSGVTGSARWVIVEPDLSLAPSAPGAAAVLPFPMGSTDNRGSSRRRVAKELARAAREHMLALHAMRSNLAAPPPGSLVACPPREGVIRLESLS